MSQSKQQRKWLIILIASITMCLVALAVFFIWTSVKYDSVGKGFAYMANNAFSDFGQLLYFTVVKNPYTSPFHTMYTPLNFIFYLPFALVCCGNDAFYALNNISGEEATLEELAEYNSGILNTWEFWLCLLVYYVIVFTVIFFIVKDKIPFEKLSYKIIFYFSMGFSTMIGFGFIRGSNVFIALAFFLGYLKWYKSDVRWKRELSLVFFAIAGTMKFYVLFSGILLLKEKRWLDTLKCVAYVFICVFLPFFIYESPIETIKVYLGNMFGFVGGEGRIGSATNISVYNLVYCFFSLFNVENSMAVTIICWIMTAFVFIAGIAICLKTKSYFTELIVIGCVFALVPSVSYLYLLSFMILPFMVFEAEKESYEKKRKIFLTIIFFILMFIPIIVTGYFFIYTCALLALFVAELIITFKKDNKPLNSAAYSDDIKLNG